ncbi:MAG: helix-turn-helix domain-containing protein [Actinomycetota bacterium]|nr:helix-turn-helix domain-containing protein [Actinomycetota bacterium]
MGDTEEPRGVSRQEKRERIHALYPVRRRPSEVFAERLKAIRKARQQSQTEVSRRMTEVGRPMSKPALLRIEKGSAPEDGGRILTLDEALAFCSVLGIAPATMLSPPEGELVWLDDEHGVDGEALRNWLHLGAVFSPATTREKLRKDIEQVVLSHAQALQDANRLGDEAGVRDAVRSLAKSAIRYSTELDTRGVAGEVEESAS